MKQHWPCPGRISLDLRWPLCSALQQYEIIPQYFYAEKGSEFGFFSIFQSCENIHEVLHAMLQVVNDNDVLYMLICEYNSIYWQITRWKLHTLLTYLLASCAYFHRSHGQTCLILCLEDYIKMGQCLTLCPWCPTYFRSLNASAMCIFFFPCGSDFSPACCAGREPAGGRMHQHPALP